MAQTIPNLWPVNQVDVSVRTPLAIMRTQAELLSQVTQGLLEGEIVTQRTDTKEQVNHFFEVVAPALGGYRVRIFTVTQSGPNAYPAKVTGLGIDADISLALKYRGEAITEEDFIHLLSMSLQSKQMIGLMQSLIARSNDEVKPVEA